MAKSIIVYFQTGQKYGYGHKYRCLEVIRAARERGWQVIDLSNDEATHWHYTHEITNQPQRNFKPGQWKMFMNRFVRKYNAEWLIFDLPNKPYDFEITYAKQVGLKIANLNGPGWAEANGITADQSWSDLVWVQDTPERIILRRDLKHILREPLENQWFVFGGAADPMNLLEKFEGAIQRDPAYLCGTKLRENYQPKHQPQHKYIECEDRTILQYMRYAARACVSFGIMAWECAAIGLPVYCFSRSAEHLHYAKKFESYNLGLAYPEIGIPEPSDMLKFFRRQIALDIRNRPDCRGTDRFLNALQEHK